MSTFSTYRDGVYEHRKKTVTANSPTTTLDLSDASIFEIDLAADTELVLSNPLQSIYTIIINQTNNYTLTWGIDVRFENATAPILPNGPAWSLKCTVIYDGTYFYVLDCENIRYADVPLLEAFPDAEAAWSLYNLDSTIDDVVRVRRDSDDQERDFSAEEIFDGTLATWVNMQDEPLPLQTASAAAAYSLRNVSPSYTGPVVKVRRSSDNAEADFTAAEVADGTMTAWVNTDVVQYTSDFTSGNEDLGEFNGVGSDGETIDGVSDAYKYTLTGGSVVHFAILSLPEYNQTYSVTLDYYIPSGQTVTDLEATLDTISQHTLDSVGAWTTETFTFVTSDDSNPNNRRIRFVTNDYISIDADGDVFYLKNIVVTQTTADGHVTTWYDQSGNGNDATQATASRQPKIVDAGSLVVENGKPAVDFDGVDDYMNIVNIGTHNEFYLNIVADYVNGYLYSGNYNLGESFLIWSSTGVLNAFTNGTAESLSVSSTLRYKMYSLRKTGVNIFLNENGVDVDTVVASSLLNGVNYDHQIGWAIPRNNSLEYFEGKIQEIIYYNSDQSSNRVSIEANINTYYNIYP